MGENDSPIDLLSLPSTTTQTLQNGDPESCLEPCEAVCALACYRRAQHQAVRTLSAIAVLQHDKLTNSRRTHSAGRRVSSRESESPFSPPLTVPVPACPLLLLLNSRCCRRRHRNRSRSNDVSRRSPCCNAHARTPAVVLMNMGGPATVSATSASLAAELIDTRLARSGPRSIPIRDATQRYEVSGRRCMWRVAWA